MSRLEGNGASRLIQLMSNHGKNDSIKVEVGTITNNLPEIKLRIDGDKIELDADDFEVCEHITNRKSSVIINGVESEIEYKDELKIGDRVVVLSANNDHCYYILDRLVSYDN